MFGFKIRFKLCIIVRWMIAEVGLHGVTCQLEIHLLLLSTLRTKHSLPQVRVVEVPCLSFTGTAAEGKNKGKKVRKEVKSQECKIIQSLK